MIRHFRPGQAIVDGEHAFYVERSVDDRLFERLLASEYTFVVAPRQVGKTSLLRRTAGRLEQVGVQVLFVDLQSLGLGSDVAREVAEPRWYRSLANAIARASRVSGFVEEVKAFFDAHTDLTPVGAWVAFLRERLLQRLVGPIVVMIDEADRTRRLPFDRNEFFAATRSIRNDRAFDFGARRLTFCFCGVTAPNEVIDDSSAIPVDLPEGLVHVPDLSRTELSAFAAGLASVPGSAERLLDALYAWTSGHPAMTQKLCAALVATSDTDGDEKTRVDRAVARLFFGEGRDTDAMLLDIDHRFPLSGLTDDAVASHSLYQTMRGAASPVSMHAGDSVQTRLLLAGLVSSENGVLVCRNRIYATTFDNEWVQRRLEGRPIAQALLRWVAADRRDELLLSGVEVARFEGWASGRELSLEEREYLEISRRKIAEAERDQARRQARTRWLVAGIALAAALAFLALALFAKRKADRASEQEQAARTAASAATAARNAERDSGARELARQALILGREPALAAEAAAAALRAFKRSATAVSIPELIAVSTTVALMEPRFDVLSGHSGFVLSAAFSPDGSRVVTASDDKTARIWDAATGKPVLSLEGHTDGVRSAVFSPDGTRIVTASNDKTARVWDAFTGELIRSLEGHAIAVREARFSPEGTSIITTSVDENTRTWDASTGKLTSSITAPIKGPKLAPFWGASPDGTRAITFFKNDKTPLLWNAFKGKPIRALERLPDGTRVLLVSNHTMAPVREDATGGLIRPLEGHTDIVTKFAFSPDGKRIATASDDKTARLWDASTGELIRSLAGHTDIVTDVAFSQDGTRIVTASTDKTARLWDASAGRLVHSLNDHADQLGTAVFSTTGTFIVTSGDRTAKLWDASTRKLVRSFEGHSDSVWRAAFSPNEAYVITASADKTAKLWDVSTGKLIRSFEGHTDSVWHAAFSPNGAHIVTTSADGTARLWDVLTGKLIRSLEGHTDSISGAAFSPDGALIVTASDDKTARLWEASTGKMIRCLDDHTDAVRSAIFSPDGSLILTASDDNTARLWHASTGEFIRSLDGHTSPVWNAAFSPDGRRIVTASADKTARLWETSTGKLIHILEGHTNLLWHATFSPDGTRVVTASTDRTARLWDASAGKLICSLEGHADIVRTAIFSPDGTQIVTASDDKTARLWPATYLEGLREVCLSIKGTFWPLPKKYEDLSPICTALPARSDHEVSREED